MRDKTAITNKAANVLLGIAVLLAFAAAALYAAGLTVSTLREVRVEGDLKHVTRDQIEDVVRREVKGGFFTADLAATRAAFERLPWVRGARIRRGWPARLEIMLEEHRPLARWGDAALVNTHGEVFQGAYDGDLPVFVGPEGTAREIAIQYRYFSRSLEVIGETPVQVRVTPRRAWQMKLRSGLVLTLGRENIEARLTRFVAAYGRSVGRLGRRIDYVDLRYANGFAVRIPELREESPGAGRGRLPG